MDSVLTSIKKLLGIAEEYEHFDSDIVMYINSAFSVLTQLGVGPEEGFRIEDASTTWSEFLYDDPRLEFVKTYIHLKVKLGFDPPLSSAAIEAINGLYPTNKVQIIYIGNTFSATYLAQVKNYVKDKENTAKGLSSIISIHALLSYDSVS